MRLKGRLPQLMALICSNDVSMIWILHMHVCMHTRLPNYMVADVPHKHASSAWFPLRLDEPWSNLPSIPAFRQARWHGQSQAWQRKMAKELRMKCKRVNIWVLTGHTRIQNDQVYVYALQNHFEEMMGPLIILYHIYTIHSSIDSYRFFLRRLATNKHEITFVNLLRSIALCRQSSQFS